MKLSTIIIVIAGAGVAFYAYRRLYGASPLAGTPAEGTIIDPSAWGEKASAIFAGSSGSAGGAA